MLHVDIVVHKETGGNISALVGNGLSGDLKMRVPIVSRHIKSVGS